jgi:hypothetical protein
MLYLLIIGSFAIVALLVVDFFLLRLLREAMRLASREAKFELHPILPKETPEPEADKTPDAIPFDELPPHLRERALSAKSGEELPEEPLT